MSQFNDPRPRGRMSRLATVLTVAAGTCGSLAQETLANQAPPTAGPTAREPQNQPPQNAASSEAILLSAKAVVAAARSQEAREWAEHFAARRQEREELRTRERIARRTANAVREAALERSFTEQVHATLDSANASDSLAFLLSTLGNGAQSASAQSSVAILEAAKQVAIQNDKSLVEMISVTAVTSEERVEMAKLGASAGAGVPPPPGGSGGSGGANRSTDVQPPGTMNIPTSIQTPSQPHKPQAAGVKRPVGAAEKGEIAPAVTSGPAPSSAVRSPEGAELGMLSPLVDKALGGVGSAAAGHVFGRFGTRFPEFSRFVCKTGNVGNRIIDGALFCPSPGGPSGGMFISPEMAELARECHERENFELRENNKVCDEDYETAKKLKAERDAKYEAEKKKKEENRP